jgi:hypothetical protein
MRKPTVPNKYNLTSADLKKLRIVDRSKLSAPRFWYNNVVKAWCISGGSGKGFYGNCIDSFWLGIYDENAKSYAGKVAVNFSASEDMCNYVFEKFYDPNEIECEADLNIQEQFLFVINGLLDDGILVVDKK